MIKNSFIVEGNLGQNPELKTSANGNSYVRVSLAENIYSKKEKSKENNEPRWHNIVLFGNMAARFAEKYSKGSRIRVEGYIDYSTYKPEDGEERRSTVVVADRVVNLEGLLHPNVKEPEQTFTTEDIPF
jgi:single-strand DNA-binding protein